ncbi:MAG: MarR family transcriptional regulator [Casimicrobiaceae bacterium]|nr:MarR family transcriptional regulator [Casimicrobiaceae bacterium]MCX8097749.1 MarR family transcriptional regulator [Casimicrobiaceae bacterium]MDW8312320.1 MarR family transcriptional regulator [Burkholderiales bacterium]
MDRDFGTNGALVPELEALPGHLIRRLQQIAVAAVLQETASEGVTPVQYAVLRTVAAQPGIDQRTLARSISLDTSTTAGVVDRLEARGLIVREPHPDDRRMRALKTTEAGCAVLARVTPAILRAQERILAPLSGEEQAEFMRLLRLLVSEREALSRVPAEESV